MMLSPVGMVAVTPAATVRFRIVVPGSTLSDNTTVQQSQEFEIVRANLQGSENNTHTNIPIAESAGHTQSRAAQSDEAGTGRERRRTLNR
jgi:hypothetical protein